MGKFAQASHKAAARDLGYTLTLGDDAAWLGFAAVISARLTCHERIRLAWATLMTLTMTELNTVAEAAAMLVEDDTPDPFDTDHWRQAVAEWRGAQRRAAA